MYTGCAPPAAPAVGNNRRPLPAIGGRFGLRPVSSYTLGSTSPIIQLLLTLRILACGGFLLDTGDSFGLTKATVGRLFDRVVTVLAGRLHQSARQVKRESDITLLDVLVDLDLVRSQTRSRTDTPTAQHGRHRLQPQPQAQAQAQALRKPIISILCFRLFFYDYDSTIPPLHPPRPPPYPPPLATPTPGHGLN